MTPKADLLTGGRFGALGYVNDRELCRAYACLLQEFQRKNLKEEIALAHRKRLAGSLALASAAPYKVYVRSLVRTVFAARAAVGEKIRKKVMGLSSCTAWPAPAGKKGVVSGAAGQGKAAGRQRLAEALRANLGRRKAQKRDRAKQAGAAAAQDETAQSLSVQSGPAKGGGITRAVPPHEDF